MRTALSGISSATNRVLMVLSEAVCVRVLMKVMAGSGRICLVTGQMG